MSFFIKPKANNGKNFNRKFSSDNNRKRKAPAKFNDKDDDITSSEDEGLNNDDFGGKDVSDEDENETAQEKKLRLAKIYLQEIEKIEKKKLEDKELDDALKGDVVQRRLKEDYLKQAGRLRSTVAKKFTGADVDNIITLKCKEHKKALTCFCITSDDKFIFSGSKDGGIVKWSIEEKKKVGSIPFVKKNIDKKIVGHTQSILSIAISSDNKFLAVGDETMDIQIWNPITLKHINTLTGHRASVTGLVFRKDTHTLYSASKDKSVKVWSLDEMSYVETMYGHLDTITSIDCLTRERAITSGGRDTTIRIWKIAEESQLIYNGHNGSIDCVKLINEENFISGGDDGQVSIWGMNKKKPCCFVAKAHDYDPTNNQAYWISSVASLVNTDLVASGSQDGLIRLWALGESFRTISSLFTIPINGFINSLSFTNDGKYLVAAIGTEHRFGRWNVVKSARNSLVMIPLIKT